MIIKDAKFMLSAADRKGFIRPQKPMIAVCGKSNVGKSSFINAPRNSSFFIILPFEANLIRSISASPPY